MGVPSFFRWLGYRYPSIITHAYEQKKTGPDGETLPNNTSEANPNGVEFDNLYLDMNGIIHPCCHPEEKLAPDSLEGMIEAICDYVERIFNIVRPRKLLYMAIDGVAPRAKMNQQRSRRFRSAIESIDNNENMKQLRQQLVDKGCKLPIKNDFKFDSNCITPGTVFMHFLSNELDKFIRRKIAEDSGWRYIHVILSDANVPGEGEHKIMDFIRKQRNSQSYDPNTHHCLNGADADLIMLGLATHELKFTILREEFIPNRPKPCSLCDQYGHLKEDCVGIVTDNAGNIISEESAPLLAEVKFLFVSLSVLREYLKKDLLFYPGELKIEYDFERCIDDWIFLCFFVGNDFLPHLPSLEIRENAIDRLVQIYKDLLPTLDDYLTCNGFLNVNNVQQLLKRLGNMEDAIFKERQNKKLAYEYRMQQEESRKRKSIDDGNQSWRADLDQKPETNSHSYFKLQTPQSLRQTQLSEFLVESKPTSTQSNQDAASLLREQLTNEIDTLKSDETSTTEGESIISPNNINIDTTNDKSLNNKNLITNDVDVEFYKEGWRSRYYYSKFDVNELDPDYDNFRNDVVKHYVQGLSWVLQYYYQGCPSWGWYYPFHYAPFASDCIDVINTDIYFPKNTQPFNPMEQLMAVFPANSKGFLPQSWQYLMEDPSSEIIDFYPTNFVVDLNGKKFAWQGVALLPFIDEKRLLKSIENNKLNEKLTDEEKERNSLKMDRIYFSLSNDLYLFIIDSMKFESFCLLKIDTARCNNMAGDLIFDEGCTKLKDPEMNVFCVNYKTTDYGENFVFEARVLNGAIEPESILKSAADSRSNYNPKLTLPNSFPQSNNNPYHLDRNAASNIIRRQTSNNYHQVDTRPHYNPQPKYTSYENPRRQIPTQHSRFHRDQYRPYGSSHHQIHDYSNWQPQSYTYRQPHIAHSNQPHINPNMYPHFNSHHNPPQSSYEDRRTSAYAHKNRFGEARARPPARDNSKRPTDPRRRPR